MLIWSVSKIKCKKILKITCDSTLKYRITFKKIIRSKIRNMTASACNIILILLKNKSI